MENITFTLLSRDDDFKSRSFVVGLSSFYMSIHDIQLDAESERTSGCFKAPPHVSMRELYRQSRQTTSQLIRNSATLCQLISTQKRINLVG